MNLIITGYSKCLRPIILIPICMLILMGCKNKTSKSPNNSNKTEEQNKKTCEDNYGSFNNGVCTCKTGYTHISGDPYRCERDEVQSSNDNDYETCDDGQRRTVAECRQQRERINSITNAQDCFNNRGFWRSSSCTLSEPISESSCEEYGDSWEGGRCMARDPYTKAQRCTSFGGNWNQEQIACQCGTDQTPFDWSNNRCSGDVYGNGGQTPEQRCAIYGGQWVNQQSCICPQNSQYNQQTGNCDPTGNGYYQSYCPGYYDNFGNCYGMTGQQMVYSVLFGWIMQSLYLDGGTDASKTSNSTSPQPQNSGH